MNNGQPTNQDDTQFFVAGTGDVSSENNSIELESNPDLGNPEQSQGADGVNRDTRDLGKIAINPSETIPPFVDRNEQGDTRGGHAAFPGLGEIVNLKMPPGSKNDNGETPSFEGPDGLSARTGKIETAKKLNVPGIRAIDNTITKLYQNDEAADFFEHVCDLREENLLNSYDRKIGEDEAA